MLDEFQKEGKYYEIWQKLFKFHKKHCKAEKDEDWSNLVNDMGQFKGEFECDICVAIVKEVERSYIADKRKKEHIQVAN